MYTWLWRNNWTRAYDKIDLYNVFYNTCKFTVAMAILNYLDIITEDFTVYRHYKT